MRYILLIVFLAFPMNAQAIVPPGTAHTVRVTFSIQDGMAVALTGLNLAGYSVTVCSLDGQAVQVGGGLAWQAAESLGLHLVTPHVAALAGTQVRAKSKWQTLNTVGAELMFDFAVIMGADIIHANAARLAGKALRVAPIIFSKKMEDWNAKQALIHPDPVLAFAGDALDPSASINIAGGYGLCQQKVFLAKAGGPEGGVADIPVLIPAGAK
jgi:hypothetical protein